MNFADELKNISKLSQSENDNKLLKDTILKIKNEAKEIASKGKREFSYTLNFSELKIKDIILEALKEEGLTCYYKHHDEDLNEPLSYSSDLICVSW